MRFLASPILRTSDGRFPGLLGRGDIPLLPKLKRERDVLNPPRKLPLFPDKSGFLLGLPLLAQNAFEGGVYLVSRQGGFERFLRKGFPFFF